MIKRILSLICVSLVCCSGVFAWDKESFVDTKDYYRFPALMSLAPLSLDEGISLFAVSADGNTFTNEDLMSRFTLATTPYYGDLYDTPDIWVPPYGTIPGNPVVKYRSASIPSQNVKFDWSYYYFDLSSIPYESGYDKTGSVFPLSGFSSDSGISAYPVTVYDLLWDFNISDLTSFTTFEFDGNISLWSIYGGDHNTSSSVDLIVNGQSVATFYLDSARNAIPLNHYIHSGTKPVESIQFRFYGRADSITLPAMCIFGLAFFDGSFSVLTDVPEYLDNVNDAQDNLDQSEAIESQWTGNMQSTFDSLNIRQFSFPTGIISGFALVSGIFSDIWRGLGDYSVVYVFPLMLGIVLLLIGRISKFAGSQSSSNKRGDGDA